MKKARRFLGIKPSGENFHVCCSFYDDNTKSTWVVYEDVLTSDKWWQYKVISEKPVAKKANYSLAYDPKSQRITGKDLEIMATHQPKMYQSFLQKASLQPKYFGPGFAASIAEMLEYEVN